jgi:hypothetical protein
MPAHAGAQVTPTERKAVLSKTDWIEEIGPEFVAIVEGPLTEGGAGNDGALSSRRRLPVPSPSARSAWQIVLCR